MLKNLGWIICLYFCKNVCESFYFPYKAFTFWFLIHYIKSYNEKHYCFIWSLIIFILMYYWLFRASQSKRSVLQYINLSHLFWQALVLRLQVLWSYHRHQWIVGNQEGRAHGCPGWSRCRCTAAQSRLGSRYWSHQKWLKSHPCDPWSDKRIYLFTL